MGTQTSTTTHILVLSYIPPEIQLKRSAGYDHSYSTERGRRGKTIVQ